MELDNSPLVSVIIPVYNAQNYIEETIQSVINQTYQNWELIIVDDCSTDDSVELVKEFEKQDSRIRLIELETNFGGPARPRNIGIDNAKGEYIAFLDADDVWSKDKVEYQINFMIKNKYNFTSTNIVRIDKDSNYLRNSLFYDFLNKLKKKKNICDFVKYSFIANSSVIIKKEIIGYFSEDKELVAVEDFYLWLELFIKKETQFYYIDDELLKYRILEDSISDRTTTSKQYVKADLAVLKFILQNNKYNLLSCFYIKVFKDFISKYIR